MTDDKILAEIEDVIRSIPDRATIRHQTPENLAWFGRVIAAIENRDQPKGIQARNYVEQFFTSGNVNVTGFNLPKLQILLNQACHDLRLRTVGPVSVAIGQGEVFRYFEAIRSTVEMATTDLLFVDRYMDAEFVAKYMPLVRAGVRVRLLTLKKVPALVAAASAFAKQNSTLIEIRSGDGFHDRWVFVDSATCYQSGASFKDGGVKDTTTFTQNVDAFPELLLLYENLWQTATEHSLIP